MISLRPFTRQDWLGLAGAEAFVDGSDPLVGELRMADQEPPAVVVVDATGLALYVAEELDSSWELFFDNDFAARALASLREGMTLTELRAMPGAQWPGGEWSDEPAETGYAHPVHPAIERRRQQPGT